MLQIFKVSFQNCFHQNFLFCFIEIRMPILHNRTYEVLQKIIKLENDLAELCRTVQGSMRRSDKCVVFCANARVEFDKECVKDQLPEAFKGMEITRGHVVAVDYRKEKVTVDCGSILEYGTRKETFFEFVLDINNVYFPKDYESKVDASESDRGYNSDA